MDPDFVSGVKCTLLWLNIGLSVHLDLYAAGFPKSTYKYFSSAKYFFLKYHVLAIIQIYCQTSIEPKHGQLLSNNEVNAFTLNLFFALKK